ALSHAFGALCVTLVGTAEFYLWAPDVPKFMMAVLSLEVILGSMTLTGSLMAAGKLQEVLPQRPVTYNGQNFVNLSLRGITAIIAVMLVLDPSRVYLYPLIVFIPLIFGVMMIIPIGGADMPTVISLLNSDAGLSAAAMGFVLDSKLLIERARRRIGLHSFREHVESHEPLLHQRSVRGVRTGTGNHRCAGGTQAGAQRHRGRVCGDSCGGEQGSHRAGLRHGRFAGATQGSRALRRVEQTRRGREVWYPPGRRPHARSHERAAGRSRHPLRQVAGYG